MDRITEYCKKIVDRLVEGDFRYLEEHGALSRVSEEDVMRVVGEYGGKLSAIPDHAYQTNAFQIYRYDDNSGYKADVDLWFDGKRSDLTLQLDIKTDERGEIEAFTIGDILVM